MLQQTFNAIVRLEWFSPLPERQQAFAAYMIKTYLRGLTDPEKLRAFCLVAAKAHYRVPAPVSDVPVTAPA